MALQTPFGAHLQEIKARKDMMQVWADHLDNIRIVAAVLQLPIKAS